MISEVSSPKPKPRSISVYIGAAVFEFPVDWDDPNSVIAVLNKATELAQVPLRNELNRALRENADLKKENADLKLRLGL
jgi:hypothetical protein